MIEKIVNVIKLFFILNKYMYLIRIGGEDSPKYYIKLEQLYRDIYDHISDTELSNIYNKVGFCCIKELFSAGTYIHNKFYESEFINAINDTLNIHLIYKLDDFKSYISLNETLTKYIKKTKEKYCVVSLIKTGSSHLIYYKDYYYEYFSFDSCTYNEIIIYYNPNSIPKTLYKLDFNDINISFSD